MDSRLYFFIISEHLPKPHQVSEGLGFEPLETEITFSKMNGIFGHFRPPQSGKGKKGRGEVWVKKSRISP